MAVLDWLLHSDPAIRWQVLRDLVHVPAKVAGAERARAANEGWGARLLALQGEDGDGQPGRWNTLRVRCVLNWYEPSDLRQ